MFGRSRSMTGIFQPLGAILDMITDNEDEGYNYKAIGLIAVIALAIIALYHFHGRRGSDEIL